MRVGARERSPLTGVFGRWRSGLLSPSPLPRNRLPGTNPIPDARTRRSFERRFTAARMARDYEVVYTRLASRHAARAREEATA